MYLPVILDAFALLCTRLCAKCLDGGGGGDGGLEDVAWWEGVEESVEEWCGKKTPYTPFGDGV